MKRTVLATPLLLGFWGLLLLLCLLLQIVPARAEEERQHVVQAGETLSQIAAKYEMTVEQLMAENGINDPNDLSVGQVLTLPDPNAPTPTPTPILHIVQAGEALSSIATLYDVSMAAIIDANDLAGPTDIQWGQALIIPDETPTPTPDTTRTPLPPTRQVATRRTIVATATTSTQLQPVIATSTTTNEPTAPPTTTETPDAQRPSTRPAPTQTPAGYEPVIHIVRPGETASGIAQFYGIELDDLLAANAIDNANAIVIGQQLLIGNVEQTVTPTSQAEIETSNAESEEDSVGSSSSQSACCLAQS